MHLIYLIHKFHNLSWITEINELFHNILIYWDAPVHGKSIKGIVHPKMKILSSFTLPQVIPNLYECLCSAEHKGRYSEECGKQSNSGAPLTSKQPGYKLSSKYFPLCLAEQRNSYRFRTTWGRVNYDRIFIFGWTIPLSKTSKIKA